MEPVRSLKKTGKSFCLLHSIIDLRFVGSAVKIRPTEGDVYFDVVAVVDPVTRDAQRLAPLLTVRRLWSVDWTVRLCPADVVDHILIYFFSFIVSYSKHALK